MTETTETPARPLCWHCGAPMADLELSPRGGPWVCLVCTRETLLAARARHASPTPPASMVLLRGGLAPRLRHAVPEEDVDDDDADPADDA
jgi:hypothetical protein